jgi:glycosyltransferase involved in cell wall biosynthesis
VQWQFLTMRKRHFLERFPAHWSILYLQPYVRGRPNTWWPRRDGNLLYVTVPSIKHIPNPLLRWLQDQAPVRALLNLLLWCWVMVLRVATGFAGSDAVLYVSNIYYGRILPWLPRRAAFYDCNDNHLAFPATPAWARGYFERVTRTVDKVVISAPLLREIIEPLRGDGMVEIANGVDWQLFDAAWQQPQPPAVMTALPRPRIGYAGALAPWIDFDLLAAVAGALPDASLVLIGPPVGGENDPARWFTGLDNVHILGSRPHVDLPQYLMQMDVTLIPFRLNALTRGVNPNKLHEYMAVGCPVVSTDFSPFIHDYEPHVRIGADADAFVMAIQSWLQAPGDPGPRRAVARAHGWDAEADKMIALVEELGRPRRRAAGRDRR